MTDNSVNDIFARLQRILENIEALLHNLDNIPGQMQATVSRVAVEGRSVTNVLENLRSTVDGFDDWYKNKSDEMRKDQLLRFFTNYVPRH